MQAYTAEYMVDNTHPSSSREGGYPSDGFCADDIYILPLSETCCGGLHANVIQRIGMDTTRVLAGTRLTEAHCVSKRSKRRDYVHKVDILRRQALIKDKLHRLPGLVGRKLRESFAVELGRDERLELHRLLQGPAVGSELEE